MPTQVLEVNWVILYFVYGLIFFIMGLVTALQSRRHSRLELARALPWLAAFGLIHGLNEWGYIFVPLHAQHLSGASPLPDWPLLNYTLIPLQTQFGLHPLVVLMIAARLLLRSISFFCLFQFGVELLLPLFPRRRWLRIVPGFVLGLWVIAVVLRAVLLSEPLSVLVATGDAWSRYFLCFPGAVLVCLGLLRQARQVRAMGLPRIAAHLTGAAVVFAIYALFGGLIVPAAPFFPANLLNGDLLNKMIGVPAPVFRSLCGLAMAFFVVRSLDIFEAETERLIANMEQERLLAADRERIGRELHDGIIQNIYSAGLILEDTDHLVVADAAAAHQQLHLAMRTLNSTIDEIRSYIFDLQPARPGELQAMLRDLIHDLKLDDQMEVDLQLVQRCPRQLAPQQVANLAQIAREALRNVAQHADAGHLVVTLSCTEKEVRLVVADDGKGFDPGSLAGDGRPGWGIANMKTRADLLGGTLALDSAPGQGVRLTVNIPRGNGRDQPAAPGPADLPLGQDRPADAGSRYCPKAKTETWL